MSLLCMTALSTDRRTALPKANSAFPVRAPGPHIVLDVDVDVPEDAESVPSEDMEYVGGIGGLYSIDGYTAPYQESKEHSLTLAKELEFEREGQARHTSDHSKCKNSPPAFYFASQAVKTALSP
jgi:hypothetical protein